MVVLLASSVSPAVWLNPESLFQRFFFAIGAVGDKIKRKNVLLNRKRREIYYFIVNFPFSHFRRITRTVGVGPNEGAWHLGILERMGFVKGERSGRYLVYHAHNIDTRTSRPSNLIPNNNASRILEYLLRNPGAKISDVTQALTINRNTVAYHIKRLETNGYVERLQSNGLRLATAGYDNEQAWSDAIANPVTRTNNLTLENETPSPTGIVGGTKDPSSSRNSGTT
jgi:DNA-binding transcriptional ArsR family regulator